MLLPNLNHLKYFADAVELGSVSASAERNLVTHPAVSRAIKAIENQLGVKLLIHKKKNFEVTPSGQAVAQKAKNLLAAASTFNSGNISQLTHLAGTVSIAVSRTIGQAFLSPILKVLSEKYPQIKVNVRFGTTGEILEKLSQDTVDIGVTIGFQRMATLKQTLLKHGQFILIRPSQKPDFTIKNLFAENLILTEPKIETELFKKQYYRKYKKQLVIQHEVASWDMITQLVADGLGIGLVPDIAVSSDKKKDVTAVKTDWLNCPYQIYLNQSKAALNSVAARTVAEIIDTKIKRL
jgi:DNA-binding transcriptional LysR family regulator